ncbi:MAG: CotH kinase family protein [Oscillospiraceae bacterium]|nr:CotH kinase family protein [Oscillospiraceae bacterium]
MSKSRYCFLLVFTLLLTAVSLAAGSLLRPSTDMLTFSVSSQGQTFSIKPFIDADGAYHVFLPSHCSLEDVGFAARASLTVDGVPIEDGSTVAQFESQTAYPMQLGDVSTTVSFYQAADMATMHISTRSGSMEHIHSDKAHKETVSITLFDENGQIDHIGQMDELKGRGNATWACRKKPYSLTLSAADDLLGMGSGEKWILLANALDESNLHNYLAFELSRQTDLGWTPECAYVELYLNGEYNGLYLLTERVEVGQERLPIDPEAGDILAAVEPNMRLGVLEAPIRTRQGRVIDLAEPKLPSTQELERAEHLIGALEDAIVSAPDGAFPALLDMDSWAKRYLIDEICANVDADLASSYFYYTQDRFFAGPVWDYDMSFGNQPTNENPAAFVAKNGMRSQRFATPYDTALLQNEAFYTRVTELYRERFLPILQDLLQNGIMRTAEQIRAAAQMNSIRWKEMFKKNPFSTTSAEEICAYLEERVQFLSSVWIDGADLCTVQFELVPNGGACWAVQVVRGEYLDPDVIELSEKFSYLDLSGVHAADTLWRDVYTGELFDITAPVTEDLFLVQEQPSQAEPQQQTQASSDGVRAVFVLGCFVVCFAGAVIIAVRRGVRKGGMPRE